MLQPTATTLSPLQVNRVRAQAQELEGVFLNTLTKQMFSSLQTDGFGEETWRSMQAEQLANTMAENGGLGIAEQIVGDLLRLQEAAQASTPTFPQGSYRS